MDGGEGGYVDEIILCVCGGGGGGRRKPKKNKNFHEEFLFSFGIVRNVDYQVWRLIGLA